MCPLFYRDVNPWESRTRWQTRTSPIQVYLTGSCAHHPARMTDSEQVMDNGHAVAVTPDGGGASQKFSASYIYIIIPQRMTSYRRLAFWTRVLNVVLWDYNLKYSCVRNSSRERNILVSMLNAVSLWSCKSQFFCFHINTYLIRRWS